MTRTILLALLLSCTTVQAAEWVSLFKTKDGKIETIADVSDINVAGNIRRVWIKILHSHHSLQAPASDGGKWVAYFLSRYAFNCDDETAKTEADSVYYDDGTLTGVPAVALPASWDPVAPETMLHAVMDFTCSWKPK